VASNLIGDTRAIFCRTKTGLRGIASDIRPAVAGALSNCGPCLHNSRHVLRFRALVRLSRHLERQAILSGLYLAVASARIHDFHEAQVGLTLGIDHGAKHPRSDAREHADSTIVGRSQANKQYATDLEGIHPGVNADLELFKLGAPAFRFSELEAMDPEVSPLTVRRDTFSEDDIREFVTNARFLACVDAYRQGITTLRTVKKRVTSFGRRAAFLTQRFATSLSKSSSG
jgi:hypothetical protein